MNDRVNVAIHKQFPSAVRDRDIGLPIDGESALGFGVFPV